MSIYVFFLLLAAERKIRLAAKNAVYNSSRRGNENVDVDRASKKHSTPRGVEKCTFRYVSVKYTADRVLVVVVTNYSETDRKQKRDRKQPQDYIYSLI